MLFFVVLSGVLRFAAASPVATGNTGTLYKAPIVFNESSSTVSPAVHASVDHGRNISTVHLDAFELPAISMNRLALFGGFELDANVGFNGKIIRFPLKFHAMEKEGNILAKRQNIITIGPIPIPSMDIKFEGRIEGFPIDYNTSTGHVKISFPTIHVEEKRQVNFWDEVIDIGIETGPITIIIGRKRQLAVVIDELSVTVTINFPTITMPISGRDT